MDSVITSVVIKKNPQWAASDYISWVDILGKIAITLFATSVYSRTTENQYEKTDKELLKQFNITASSHLRLLPKGGLIQFHL